MELDTFFISTSTTVGDCLPKQCDNYYILNAEDRTYHFIYSNARDYIDIRLAREGYEIVQIDYKYTIKSKFSKVKDLFVCPSLFADIFFDALQHILRVTNDNY